MLLHNKKVVIVGGGPGGLTLARLLQQQGVSVQVYERDASPHVRLQGSALDLHHDSGLKALTAAGLLEEFKQTYRPGADAMVVVNGQLEVLLDQHTDKVAQDFGDEGFRPEIDRGPLRDLLLASLQEGTMMWDAHFKAMQPAGAGWDLYFENGTHAYADVVVAADGANSKVRAYATEVRPVYSGFVLLEGSLPDAAQRVPALWQLLQGGSLTALENGQTISFMTKGDGTLNFWIWVKKPENWLATSGITCTDRAAVAAWFTHEFSTWSPTWQEVFANEVLTVVPRPSYYFPLDQPWPSQPNLTLLGDAAHQMPPNGEGVNQAMVDALDLAEALGSTHLETTGQAIAAYEEKMRQRMVGVEADTRELLDLMHADNNQEVFLRIFSGNPDVAPNA
ncbi:FAD-dependent oxidoreductase [Hymenobacter profundi]|uniref:FAD-dependent monooxygenase n=1 Tax=Hymenobacter profundi TaxID=1982110 RepID=A0ABS6WW18_9BACT|nr:NAD(P)/FAD-dependent oxidoreductase [Hymenobacter profundi]MBW3127749.1 FAD-dependent monooxygenase [Hymenobacter profundi]